jgi:hypothetical protein
MQTPLFIIAQMDTWPKKNSKKQDATTTRPLWSNVSPCIIDVDTYVHFYHHHYYNRDGTNDIHAVLPPTVPISPSPIFYTASVVIFCVLLPPKMSLTIYPPPMKYHDRFASFGLIFGHRLTFWRNCKRCFPMGDTLSL